jgi:hypothetical protein
MKKFVTCVKLLTDALKLQQENLRSDNQLLIIIINKKTCVLNLIGDHKETISLYTLVNSLKRSNVTEGLHMMFIRTLENIATAFLSVLKFDEALRINKQILCWRIENLEKCDVSTMTSLNIVANLLSKMNQFKDAFKILD